MLVPAEGKPSLRKGCSREGQDISLGMDAMSGLQARSREDNSLQDPICMLPGLQAGLPGGFP